MHIGVSTLTYLHLDYRAAVSRLAELGVKVIELFYDYPHFDLEKMRSDDSAHLRRLVERYGITWTLHTPCFDLNPASANLGARMAALTQYQHAIRFAAEIGIREVVVHSGHRSDPKIPPEQAFQWGADTLRRTSEASERAGVRLAVENTGYGAFGFIQSPRTLVDLVSSIDSDLAGITLDTGHAVLEGFAPEEAVRVFGDRLTHIHVHGNSGTADDHFPLGKGVINHVPTLKALRDRGFQGFLILETYQTEQVEEQVQGDLRFLREHVAP
jgi:sugar phosphate isomerase/epimerase